jgi:hypothetical protein
MNTIAASLAREYGGPRTARAFDEATLATAKPFIAD